MQHIDTKYFSLCDWVERDLIILEQIDTPINIANHLTPKFYRAFFFINAQIFF
jgi:hypothetical protein